MAALPGLLRSRITVVWLFLIAATITSLLLGTDNLVSGVKLASALVIVVAFVKVRFVGMYFMEIGNAPVPLRAIFQGYCAVVCTVLVVMLLTSH